MTLYVYNPARERIGLVEDIRSLQWLSEYQDAGEIKLVCSATETVSYTHLDVYKRQRECKPFKF